MTCSGQTIMTRYGLYTAASMPRLNLTYDYEHGTLLAFCAASDCLGITRFIDVGANIGCYSVYLSRISSVKSIYAFEPAPEAYKEMKRNISLQKTPELFHPFDIAASDKGGDVRFYLVGPLAGNNSVEPTDKSTSSVTVKSAPLDDIMAIRGETIAIKIDVEGHELQVLNGMRKILAANRCLLQVESLEPALANAMDKVLLLLGYKKLFVLRDDYIFISHELEARFDELQNLYFKQLQEDLREFLNMKNQKRAAQGLVLQLASQLLYTKDPLAPES